MAVYRAGSGTRRHRNRGCLAARAATWNRIHEIRILTRRRYAREPGGAARHGEKFNLSEFLDRAEAGEEIVITRRGHPIAKLATVAAAKPRPIDWAAIGAFRNSMPRNKGLSATAAVRQGREERY